MSIFDRLNRVPEQDCTEAQPKSGVRLFFFLLQNNTGKLLLLNLLFIAFSLPVLTMPAAFCAMYRVCVQLVREGHCFLWSDFWNEFKSQLFNSFPVGLLFGLMLFAAYLFYVLCVSSAGINSVLFAALAFSLLVFFALEAGYSFVMLATLKLGNADILRNALALTGLEPKTDCVLALLFILFVVFAVFLFPFSLLFLLFFLYSFHALAVTTAVNAVVQKHIIAPSEEREHE